jgi:hypothetical protein
MRPLGECPPALTRQRHWSGTLGVCRFLELATQAVLRCAEDSSRSSASCFRDIRTVAAAANRAAYHVSANVLTATAKFDIMRRDVVLGNCSGLPSSVKIQLRQAPVGGSHLFGPTWNTVKDSAKDVWPRPPRADNARFQAARKVVGRALRRFRPYSQPAPLRVVSSNRQPAFGRRRPFPAAVPAFAGALRKGGRGRAK